MTKLCLWADIQNTFSQPQDMLDPKLLNHKKSEISALP